MPPKRKSDAGDASTSGSTAKRARGAHASAVALVNTVLANPDAFPLGEDAGAIRKAFVELAAYARSLEDDAAQVPAAAPAAPKPKTKEQLEEAAEKIRKAANSGIRKQMTWKPSCKTGSAKWLYDGICPDPEVFGVLLRLGGPPTFKQKKFSKDDFEACIGRCEGSVRYDTLRITSSDVNVRWSETGEFKFSGTYGK